MARFTGICDLAPAGRLLNAEAPLQVKHSNVKFSDIINTTFVQLCMKIQPHNYVKRNKSYDRKRNDGLNVI